ncbi:MAG: MCE family protein, partial [Acidimicrobiales bacterium]
TLDGVDVGLVKSVSLVPGGAKVTMTLNPGTHVPSNVQAVVAVANPLGEQEVDLVPRAAPSIDSGSGVATDAARGTVADPVSGSKAADPPSAHVQSLRNGAVIPAAPDSTPAQVGTVVAEATKLLQSIPAGSLDELLHEAAVALNGNVGSLRTIASASVLFSQEFLAQQQQFEALLSNAPPVLDTVTQNASSLQQGLADTAVLVQVLANHSNDLSRLFDSGSQAASALQALVTENEPNLACIVHDGADISANLGSAANLHNLSTVLSTNQLFFGAISKLAVTGPAIAMNTGDSARTDQEWLRTRLLIPDLQTSSKTPQPVQYSTPTSLPPVLPGAGCDTEFGQGAGPVTQAGFKPAGPGAKVVPATAAEAQVRGGGTEPTAAAPASARLRPGIPSEWPAMLAGMVMLGWLVTLGHRRSSRSARPLRVAVRNSRRDPNDRRRGER